MPFIILIIAQLLTTSILNHGGWHLDKASGQYKLGEPEVVAPIVSDKSGSKMEIYTQFSPEHPEST
jgi:hypothetical protein